MIPAIYLKVNGQIYYNELLARYESFRQKKPITFHCLDRENEALDWTKEPSESMDILMASHAKYLQNKYDKIILTWSGGTDSQTIYNIFVQNNIHIDEIFVLYDSENEPLSYPQAAVDWILKNHKDKTTKITPQHRFDPVKKSRIFSNDNWIFENSAMIPRFAIGCHDKIMLEYLSESYGSFRWCLINGIEQPDVIRTPSGFYSRHNAASYKVCMGFDNTECFFTEPLLALKQAHLIKNFIKRYNIPLNGKPYRFKSNENYTFWANMIGRHKEFDVGASFRQKDYEVEFEKQELNHIHIDTNLTAKKDAHLKILLEKDSTLVKNYVGGIRNVLAEKDFCQYIMDTSPAKTNSVIGKLAGERIFSKPMFLGT